MIHQIKIALNHQAKIKSLQNRSKEIKLNYDVGDFARMVKQLVKM
jgi:hypothetical protein